MDQYLQLEQKDLGHRVDPEVILSLGEKAARMHTENGVDLTDAVLQTIEGKALNPAHVYRITETANQRAYLLLYDAMPGPVRAVSFSGGPARIFEIVEKVFGKPAGEPMAKAAARKEPVMAGRSDYLVPPSAFRAHAAVPQEKVAALTESDIFMDKMPLEKLAQMMGEGLRSPGGKVQIYHMIKAASDQVTQDFNALQHRFTAEARGLEKMAYEAINEGFTPEDIARVVMAKFSSAPADDEGAKYVYVVEHVLRKIGKELHPERIPWGKAPAEGHPLTKAAERLVKVASEFETKYAEMQDLNEALAYVTKKLTGGR